MKQWPFLQGETETRKVNRGCKQENQKEETNPTEMRLGDEENTNWQRKSQRSSHKQKYILEEQPGVITSRLTYIERGTECQREEDKEIKLGWIWKRRWAKKSKMVRDFVTQSVGGWPCDSPRGFTLDPTERSELLLNYLLPRLTFSDSVNHS